MDKTLENLNTTSPSEVCYVPAAQTHVASWGHTSHRGGCCVPPTHRNHTQQCFSLVARVGSICHGPVVGDPFEPYP